MTSKILSLFSLLLLSLFLGCGNPVHPASVHASTPGNFTSTITIVNPPYGMLGGIFNRGTTPIYLDAVTASVGPAVNYDPTTDGYIGFGYGISNAEEDQCQSGMIYWDDSIRLAAGLPLATTAGDTQAHVQVQPCTPHGLQYGICISNCVPANRSDAVYNYTNVDAPNPEGIKRCWGESCDLTVPRTIAPGTGVTIWISRYRLSDGAAFGIAGKATVTFNFHQ